MRLQKHLILLLIPFLANATQLTLVNPDGKNVDVSIGSSEKFSDVMNDLQNYFLTETELEHLKNTPLTLTVVMNSDDQVTVKKKSNWRNYLKPVTKAEKAELAYIIKTLAYDSIVSIGLSQSSLNKAGDRIEHLHPFRFLLTIFEDEELKCGAHAIRDRGGMVWNGFLGGVIRSSNEETANDNMKIEYIQDFAKKLGISAKLIQGSIQQSRWKELVNILIDEIPRNNDPNRYDM